MYKAIHNENKVEVAAKIIPIESPDEVESIAAEIDLLMRLSGPYVVEYVNSFLFENELWIIMEYCAGGSMSDIFEIRQCPLEEEYLRAVVAYSVLGLVHLHNLMSIHRVSSCVVKLFTIHLISSCILGCQGRQYSPNK